MAMTVASLVERFEAGGTAEDIVEAALAEIRGPAGQGGVSFISVDADGARAAAAQIDAQRSRGSAASRLSGIPIGIKDLFDVQGQPTRAGGVASLRIADRDAVVVATLRDAGLIPIGRNNMTEFAFSGLGANPHYDTPLSPWRREDRRIAGGSTSGGAAAVADGMVPLALGTDTGGSCRIPAAFCGIVGFKPTAARFSSGGVVPLSPTLDSVGWLGGTVDCVVALDDILAPRSEPRPEVALRDLSLVVPTDIVLDALAPEVAGAFDRAVERLAQAGVSVARLPLPELQEIQHMNRLGGFPAFESYQWHRDRLEAHARDYDPRVLSRIMRGSQQTAADFAQLQAERASLIDRVRRRVSGSSFLLFPTVPILPPRLEDIADDEAYTRLNLLALRNSTIVNLLDGCAISLPAGGREPVGVTIAGFSGQDDELLSAAVACEATIRGAGCASE